MSPVLSAKALSRGRLPPSPSVLDSRYVVRVTSGRVALAMALEHAGIGAGAEVLLPAYHCESMVTPVRWREATAVFYRIRPDTAIDLEALEGNLSAATRAIVVTHFFGFPQDIVALRGFCDKHGLVMIEDCAHSFFGKRDGYTLGSLGDYAISSTMKFFAVYDGGCLSSNSRNVEHIPLVEPSTSLQVKCAFNIVERALAYRRLRGMALGLNLLIRSKDLAWRLIKGGRNGAAGRSQSPSSAEGAFEFDPAWMNVRMSHASRWILERSLHHDIVTPRRRNFERILEATRDLPGCRPLFSALPDEIAPLVFPLFVDEPDAIFPRLKYLGLPIWRFGEFLDHAVAPSTCAVSTGLSQHLLQFPCHQELRDEELEWMIGCIRKEFSAANRGSP